MLKRMPMTFSLFPSIKQHLDKNNNNNINETSIKGRIEDMRKTEVERK